LAGSAMLFFFGEGRKQLSLTQYTESDLRLEKND